MSLPIVFQRIARTEFDEAADWYEAGSPGWGTAFTAAVREVLTGICTNSTLHPIVHGAIREALLRRYPYAVYDLPEPGRITVITVYHTARIRRTGRTTSDPLCRPQVD